MTNIVVSTTLKYCLVIITSSDLLTKIQLILAYLQIRLIRQHFLSICYH